MPQHAHPEHILSIIYRPIQIWLIVILLAYLAVQFLFPSILGPLNKPNGQVFLHSNWLNLAGGCFLLIAYLLNFWDTKGSRIEAARAFMIILLSVILLALAVFLTGGFTDSPFAGAVALYMGFFIILSRRRAYPKTIAALIITTVALLAAPYIFLLREGYGELHILHWIDHPGVLWSRWGISIVILIIAAIIGDKITDQVSDAAVKS